MSPLFLMSTVLIRDETTRPCRIRQHFPLATTVMLTYTFISSLVNSRLDYPCHLFDIPFSVFYLICPEVVLSYLVHILRA